MIALAELYERDKGLCGLCGFPVAPVQATRDHITPRAAGGSNAATNLRLAHAACNQRRGTETGSVVVGPKLCICGHRRSTHQPESRCRARGCFCSSFEGLAVMHYRTARKCPWCACASFAIARRPGVMKCSGCGRKFDAEHETLVPR